MNEAHPAVQLAIYNKGASLVKERRTVEFESGVNTLDFTDVTATIQPRSVTFVSLSDPGGTFVHEQSYHYDLVNYGALLQRYLGQEIALTTTNGNRFSGVLISGSLSRSGSLLRRVSRDGGQDGAPLILRREDGEIVAINAARIQDVRFPSLPEGLVMQPTLRWLVESAQDGPQDVEVTYLTGDLNWSADYSIHLARDNETLALTGWVTINNDSGKTFADAQIKLIAGDVHRPPRPEGTVFGRPLSRLARSAGPPEVEQRDLFEYHLYAITQPVMLADRESKQIEFINVRAVPAKVRYICKPRRSPRQQSVQVWLHFDTGAEAGLGRDLPEGRVRVFQADEDGGAILIGENNVAHTPQGEHVKLQIGAAYDLVSERVQLAFKRTAQNVVEETVEIKLRSHKDADTVTVQVHESFERGVNITVVETTHEFEFLDSSTAEFPVEVAPGAEVVIRYTVRYDLPAHMQSD